MDVRRQAAPPGRRPPKLSTVSSSGVATWSASYNPENSTAFPEGAQSALGIVVVTAGGMQDSGTMLAQSPSDVFGMYPTPASNIYTDNQTGANLPIDVVVGATVTMGIGFNINGGYDGNPFQMTCNWASSDNSIATVSRYGMATAVSPGSVTITCGQAGNGVYGTGSAAGQRQQLHLQRRCSYADFPDLVRAAGWRNALREQHPDPRRAVLRSGQRGLSGHGSQSTLRHGQPSLPVDRPGNA